MRADPETLVIGISETETLSWAGREFKRNVKILDAGDGSKDITVTVVGKLPALPGNRAVVSSTTIPRGEI